MSKEKHIVWGFDIGIGSCGWAVLNNDEKKIVDMGVRLWDVPQEPKTKVSCAATRRNARSTRRNTKRTADRKKHCLRLLIDEGIVPEDETAKWLQTVAGEPHTIVLRAEGLDRLLTDREWAQVLYSICSKRGYIPHGEARDDTDSERKKVLTSISNNKKKLEDEGFRTVGEMLAQTKVSRNKGGEYSLSVSNAMLVEEVNLLFEAQRSFGSQCASADMHKKYLEIFLWQKDVSNHDAKVYRQVGFCSYEIFKNEKRAAKADLSFELCNAYERVGHTRIVHADGTEIPLPSKIRHKIIEILFSPVKLPKNETCKVTFADIRKWMDLKAADYFKGVPTEKEKTRKIADPKAWSIIRKTLPEEMALLLRKNRELADQICEAVAYASSEQSLKNRLLETTKLSDDSIREIVKLPYSSKVFNGYGSRSRTALDLLIESFEDEEAVVTLSDAEQACGLQTARLYSEKTLGNKLPPYQVFDPTNKNPVVLRAMGQVRRIVNALYAKYGAPEAIRVELARELKQSKRERKKISEAQNKVHDQREGIRNKLAEEFQSSTKPITMSDIKKVELFNEQDGLCPYCGKSIHYEQLVESLKTHDHAFEVDHILPFSRTCDDSQSNKVLVHVGCNQKKENRTPYEWMTQEGLDWSAYEERVATMTKLRKSKQTKLLNRDLSEKKEVEFIKRNLNDTRYASKETLAYLNHYLAFSGEEKQHVFAVAGGATAQLRNAWGIRKNRSENDLHHAVDASVIAACTPVLVQKIARASENKHFVSKEKREQLFRDTEPWSGFSEEAIGWENKFIPSRKVEHGVTGRVFEDTIYSFQGMSDDGIYGLLKAKKSVKKSTNFIKREDGSALLPDGIAFVRLWWDPNATVRGRKNKPGQYLIEPVYFADFPSIAKGNYIPKGIPSQNDKKDRSQWNPIPNSALEKAPIVLFRNDAISYRGELMRYDSVDIANNYWILLNPIDSSKKIRKGYPLSGITEYDQLRLVEDDILGSNFKQYLK